MEYKSFEEMPVWQKAMDLEVDCFFVFFLNLNFDLYFIV